jgi:nucleoside-diphosphate-sugar epimerase
MNTPFDYFSIAGERDVPLAMKLNIEGTHHILELARKYKCRLFIPSTIGLLFQLIVVI